MEQLNEAMFKTKVDNIFVKVYTGIMRGDLSDVSHFIGHELQSELQNKIDDLKNVNSKLQQQLDQLKKENETLEKVNKINQEKIKKLNEQLNEEFTISNQEVSSIEKFIYKEKVDEYKPHYQNVKKPVNMARNFNSPILKKEYEDKYKREVAEYSANLILAEQHNKEEERKYKESIGKTKDRIAIRFWYKKSMENGVLGLVFVGLNKIRPKGFIDVDFIINNPKR